MVVHRTAEGNILDEIDLPIEIALAGSDVKLKMFNCPRKCRGDL